jgi:hypothetical protein
MLDGVTSLDGTGSVITVPVNDGAAGTAGNILIAVTLPVALAGGTGTSLAAMMRARRAAVR